MRNLIQFLLRYHAFFLFVILELFCLSLVVRYNRYHHAAFVNSGNELTGRVYSRWSGWTDYLDLKRVNDSLLVDNARLRALTDQAVHIDTVSEVCVEDSLIRQVYTYIPARVIKNQTGGLKNFITLDKGKRHGVAVDMGVISADGIVGKVVGVSENFSVVMSLLHTRFSVRAALEKNNVHGSLHWNGSDPETAELQDIPRHVALSPGDRIVTTGFSSVFPAGIRVGDVREVKGTAGENFQEISVTLSTDFRALRNAYIVNYLFKDERTALEAAELP